MPTMTKAEKFLEMKYLSGELEEVPGLGSVGIGNLKKKNINTTYQLIGKFLRLNRDEGAMYKFLVEQGNREQDVKRTAEYLRKRVANKGFVCNIKLSDHVIKTATSLFDDAKKTAFLRKQLTGNLREDFFGIKDTSKFEKNGITNTDQLMGAFLATIDNPDPSQNTDKCDGFYKTLQALGASPGHKSAIVYQLQSKLAVGIDSFGDDAVRLGLELPTLDEVPEDALDEDEFDLRQRSDAYPVPQTTPVTGAGARRATPVQTTPQNLQRKFDSAAAGAAQSSPNGRPPSGGSTNVPLVVGVVLLAVAAAWVFSGSAPSQAALAEPEGTWL